MEDTEAQKQQQSAATKATLKMGLYKKAGGYKPYFYNTSTDFCRFLEDTSRNFFINFIFNFLNEFSNLNHSCPFDNDIIVKDLVAPEEKFRMLPIPIGEYMLKIILIINKKERSAINVFVERSEAYKALG
ncbi:uncharacterized protein LOC106088868 [Stomoxys calcitrans]|uniref:uncharacterized protein LOC106088868 n=1 Tax=Stomoxys calcitrans TaxID=35570 RepID=UPI0027E21D45|nr:uncharacterized protein LOC106088868 [Stomoxys calcitrans]